MFARYNCDVKVGKAASDAFEVRVSPRAFNYHSVFLIKEREMRDEDLPKAFRMLRTTLDAMIDNVFTNGFAPRKGYPRGIMDPDLKQGASL